MTPIHMICTYLICFAFAVLLIDIISTLYCIDKGEYKKAIYMSTVAVVLTIIVFVGILIAF